MYCIPYTGFGEIMYRNLTVLEAAGIDTATPPATWEEWYAQMQKVKESGKFAVPDQTQVFNSVASMYAIRGDKAKWGIDFDKRETLMDPEATARRVTRRVHAHGIDPRQMPRLSDAIAEGPAAHAQ